MGCSSPVMAIAPMSGGKAPGIAPTRTAREDTLLRVCTPKRITAGRENRQRQPRH